MTKSIRPKVRPTDIGATEGGSTRGINPKDNYSEQDLKKLTSSAVGKMTISEMKRLLQNEKDAENRAILRKGIEKAVAEAMSSDSKKPTVKPKPRPQQKKRGGMIRTGHTDMRKGGMFMK
tara:strand:+ start:113 stop:472 length:360 start_codon:yes stop_codon:yes gene_type:complete